MKITAIRVYQQHQPFVDGSYRCRNQTEHGFLSTVVKMDTDSGHSGWGEIAPLGAFYSEAFAEGVLAGLTRLAPLLLGGDPRECEKRLREMDAAMAGQADVKTPLDMAMWDLAAQSAELPLAEYLGGRYGESVDLYRSISQASGEQMRAKAVDYLSQGYRRLQVKVGGDPLVDAANLQHIADAVGPNMPLYCDANGAWQSHEALRFLAATRHLDYTLEQPCASYEEHLRVRRVCEKPMVLDESIDSLAALLRAQADGATDGVTLKIARLGGITRTRRLRDLAVEFGLKVTVEDIGGAQIDTAAMAHLSLSTPETHRTHTVDFHHWVTCHNAAPSPEVFDGQMMAPTTAGLGVVGDLDQLGAPLFQCQL